MAETDVAALTARLQVLEDREEIARLKASYCNACDDDHNGPAIAALFVDEGTWQSSRSGLCAGPEQISSYMLGIRASGRIRHSIHLVTNPIISVDGDSAAATWSFVMMYQGTDDAWFRIIGFYDDHYVRRDGHWRFLSLYSSIQDYARYEARPIA